MLRLVIVVRKPNCRTQGCGDANLLTSHPPLTIRHNVKTTARNVPRDAPIADDTRVGDPDATIAAINVRIVIGANSFSAGQPLVDTRIHAGAPQVKAGVAAARFAHGSSSSALQPWGE